MGATRHDAVRPPALRTDSASGARDAMVAILGSWAVVLVVTFQGVASMASMVSGELNGADRILGVVCTLATSAAFVWLQQRVYARRTVSGLAVALVCLSAFTGFVVGAWLNAGTALAVLALTLGRRLGGVALVGTLVVLGAFMITQEVHPLVCAWYLVVDSAIAVLLYAMTRLAVVVGELARARERVARMKVDEERLRISRDLHDILGRSLVAVSLRVQTALRLVDRDAPQCRRQLDEIARMVADGQSSLRSLTRGETFLGLDHELRSAADLLERLHIAADIDAPGPVRPAVDQLGARILRESVTNMLKHSRPERVQIHLREETSMSILAIVNDGATHVEPGGGTGLADLAAHVARAGGTLEATHLDDGRFRVMARVPHSRGSASSGVVR